MAVGRRLRAAAYDVVGWRDGFGGWRKHRRKFRRLMHSAVAEVEGLVAAELAAVGRHAFETVPYYRETWRAVGVDRDTVVTPATLQQLPLLTKEHIREQRDALISDRFAPSSLDRDFTGGTTGTHSSFYRDRECGIGRLGRQLGALERCGYRPGIKRGVVWGAHGDLPDGTGWNLKRRIREFATAQEVICCTTMNRAEMGAFYERLRRFRPRVLYAYPNALYELARYLTEEKLEPLQVSRVLCTAEVLTQTQRRTFEEVFGAEVFDLYCSREHGCVGFECSQHEGLHIDVGSVFVEILCDGRPARPGECGEIVITDLLNYGMPFIRHATGDLGRLASAPCACGLALPRLESLDGRVTDMLYRPDGQLVAGVMLPDLFMDVHAVRAAQFVQDTPDQLDVRLVVDGGLSEDLRGRLVAEIRTVMGDQIAIFMNVVTDIPRNPRSGKFQEVICRVDPAMRPEHSGRVTR